MPRFGAFEPNNKADIYAHASVLVLITCQACGKRYHVCFSGEVQDLTGRIHAKTLHYGDPPNGCDETRCEAGASMNSEPRRVLEFWHQPLWVKDAEGEEQLNLEWFRVSELEIDIDPDWVGNDLGDE